MLSIPAPLVKKSKSATAFNFNELTFNVERFALVAFTSDHFLDDIPSFPSLSALGTKFRVVIFF